MTRVILFLSILFIAACSAGTISTVVKADADSNNNDNSTGGNDDAAETGDNAGDDDTVFENDQSDDYDVPSSDSESFEIPDDYDSPWKTFATGKSHNCQIRPPDNKLYCWGSNSDGQIGDGTVSTYDYQGRIVENNDKLYPTKISDEVWLKIAAGGLHNCAIKSGGSLYCWGSNNSGEIGDSTAGKDNLKLTPVKIGDDKWREVTAGSSHTCGINVRNELFCWGSNSSGKLGDGTMTDKSVPTKIDNDAWLTVTAGEFHTCGIKAASRKLYCWGRNNEGQVGDDSNSNQNMPVKLDDNTWRTVAAGYNHNCAIKSDGTLYCWGRNFYGQLGDGTNKTGGNKTVPVKISNEMWDKVTAGGEHTCAFKLSDRKRFCWGRNFLGQLGDGTSGFDNMKLYPEQIGEDQWLALSLGFEHTCGIKDDNDLYCWGGGGGILGVGSTEASVTSPAAVIYND